MIVSQWKEAAGPALADYKSGQWNAALDEVKQALAADMQNPDALAIAGLAAYRAGNQVPQSKTYFTSLATADPTSVLAENNLAVIAGVQKSPVEGFTHYMRGLAIDPGNRLLIDNIQEAVNSYLSAGGDKNNTVLKTLQRQLEPAEANLEREMARKENGGLQRFGASWMTQEQLNRFTALQAAARAEMAQLDSQYQAARSALASIETQIAQTNANIQAETNNALALDLQLGVTIPGVFQDFSVIAAARDAAVQNVSRLQGFLAQLQTEHGQFLAAARDYFAQADRVKAALAGGLLGSPGGFTGMQRIMDWGEDQKPPAPATVADLPALPAVPALPTFAIAPPPLAVPTAVPSQTPIFVPVQPPRSGR